MKKKNIIFYICYLLSFFITIPFLLILLAFFALITTGDAPNSINTAFFTICLGIYLSPFVCLTIYSIKKNNSKRIRLLLSTIVCIILSVFIVTHSEEIRVAYLKMRATSIELKADSYYYINEDIEVSYKANSNGDVFEVDFIDKDGKKNKKTHCLFTEEYKYNAHKTSDTLDKGSYIKTSKDSSITLYILNETKNDAIIEFDSQKEYPYKIMMDPEHVYEINIENSRDVKIVNEGSDFSALICFEKNNYSQTSLGVWEGGIIEKQNIADMYKISADDSDDISKVKLAIRVKTKEQLNNIKILKDKELDEKIKPYLDNENEDD